MTSRKVLLPLLLVCLALSARSAAQKKNQTSDVPVTSTLADTYTDPATGQAMLMQIGSDRVDGGAYKNTAYVESIIQSIGDWELDAFTSSLANRQIYLEFSRPVAGTGPNGGMPVAPFASAVLKGRFISKCHEYNNSMFTLPAGETMRCPMIVRFDFGGSSYRIHMSPDTSFYQYPDTNYVNITCAGADASAKCNRWRIEPSGGCVTADCSVRANRAKLVRLYTSKGKTVEENRGDYLMPFRIEVTNP